jgi:hypothetical protein
MTEAPEPTPAHGVQPNASAVCWCGRFLADCPEALASVVAPESTPQVFWRLVKAGMPSGEIGNHPDYRAAIEREMASHGEGCPTRQRILAPCGCEVQR